eukprot:scaffold402_cov166-Ochromonas_danica.AAC.2
MNSNHHLPHPFSSSPPLPNALPPPQINNSPTTSTVNTSAATTTATAPTTCNNSVTNIPCTEQDFMKKVVEDTDLVLCEIAKKDQRHPTFIYLQWSENETLRKELIRKIILDIPTYVRAGGDYAIKRHARAFQNTLTSVARRNQAVLIGQLESDHLREFLLSCMILIHSLFPDYDKLKIEMRDLVNQFQHRPEFQNMSLEEWKVSLKFRNYLVVSLQFISPAHNKVKMINSSAMLCGINNCLQGGGRTTQARRLYSIFEHVSSLAKDLSRFETNRPSAFGGLPQVKSEQSLQSYTSISDLPSPAAALTANVVPTSSHHIPVLAATTAPSVYHLPQGMSFLSTDPSHVPYASSHNSLPSHNHNNVYYAESCNGLNGGHGNGNAGAGNGVATNMAFSSKLLYHPMGSMVENAMAELGINNNNNSNNNNKVSKRGRKSQANGEGQANGGNKDSSAQKKRKNVPLPPPPNTPALLAASIAGYPHMASLLAPMGLMVQSPPPKGNGERSQEVHDAVQALLSFTST